MMHKIRHGFIWLMVLMMFQALSPLSDAAQAKVFVKPYQGKTLSGKAVTFPRGFEKQLTLLIVAFNPNQQGAINTWLSPLRQLSNTHPEFGFYECPVVDSKYSSARIAIEAFMKKRLPGKWMYEKTLPLFVDSNAWKQRIAASDNGKGVYLFLLNRQGQTVWQGRGGYNPTKLSKLSNYLKNVALSSK
ncbi:MAG: hypothetical protein KTR14_05990 [Vampirovibrio sp.]|nr:hypothetical protein [Vampirovibrio sp.]